MAFSETLWQSIEGIFAKILEHPFLKGLTELCSHLIPVRVSDKDVASAVQDFEIRILPMLDCADKNLLRVIVN
jgi:hypothetical protein